MRGKFQDRGRLFSDVSPEARVPANHRYRKAAGREATLSDMGHATMKNRHGLAVAGTVTGANGTAERRASETMLKAKAKAKAREAGRHITVGEDKAEDIH